MQSYRSIEPHRLQYNLWHGLGFPLDFHQSEVYLRIRLRNTKGVCEFFISYGLCGQGTDGFRTAHIIGIFITGHGTIS
jgi:hypothetical protein